MPLKKTSKKKPSKTDLYEFLTESNAIEGVYGLDSFTQAYRAWEYVSGQKKLTPQVVLRTHKILMLNQPLQPDEKGYFRKCAVYIGGGMGANHTEVPSLVEEWCRVMNWKTTKFDDQEDVSKHLHVQYEKIHPFVDGNGRTGRIFMNWWRIKNGLPLLIIHEGEEQMKYYKWFR